MALQSFDNKLGTLIMALPQLNPYTFSVGGIAIDAAGESLTFIGHMSLQGGTGSKTISSSGGIIYWRASAATFANAGSNLRIGIQDVGATGLEDGTFDVYADLVGGTDAINITTFNATAMETGTKTIAHGDLIAISIELTARAGADTISVIRNNGTAILFPYSTLDVGSGPAKSAVAPLVTFEFDDGTVGWLDNMFLLPGSGTGIGTNTTFASNSVPDERSLIFQLPFSTSISGVLVHLANVTSTDNFEIILYSTPLGTPVAERTVSVDANIIVIDNASAIPYQVRFATPFTLAVNTKYAIAIRPTTTNSLSLREYEFGTNNEQLLRPTALGENWYLGTRSDQTGAFSEVTTTLPSIGFYIDKLEEGV